jgi:aminobenzoyl-glutamate utilization protein B
MSTTNGSEAIALAIEAARPAVERICAEVWTLAEISLREVESAQVHQRELEAAGFQITSTGTAGVPTAFIAEWSQGAGGPSLGFLVEYDALPGLGNEAVPRQEPRADGTTSGHGCGHNLIGAGLSGAAMAAKHVMEAEGIAGTLRVYGCASEENEGAKVYMARAGLFDDVDACLHWHTAPVAGVINVRMAATNALKIEFRGRTAHAGLEPWKGRSALHALEIAAHSINLMREHLEPTARTHYVFEAAGVAPNVVTDYTRLWMTIRDADRTRVVATTNWVRQIAEGAALATQTEAQVNVYYGLHDLLPNTPLAERMQQHLEQVGVPAWSDEEQTFASACQHAMGLPEQGMATTVLPLQAEPTVGGSSDVAEVSWLTPTMGLVMPTLPLHIPLHTWAVTACAGMSIGVKGAMAAAEVLTRTALDLLTDAELRAAAKADLARRTEGFSYVSPLPPGQAHPVNLPEWLLSDGSTEAVARFGRVAGRTSAQGDEGN